MSLPDWLVVLILGFVEGLTEFIPVSSTGHLLVVENWLPRQSDLFNIVIQSGAVLAVLPLFRKRLAMLTRLHEAESRDLLAKICVCFGVTGVGGLLLDRGGFTLPDQILPVALALIIGGLLFIVVEKWLIGRQTTTLITWNTALLVAVAQLVAAVFPGASRSGATILFAMLLSTNRVAATEFSFLVGIPTLLAAGALKTYKALHHGTNEDWGLLALGTLMAALVSFVAVKWLLGYVRAHSFIGFGIYRIILGGILLACLAFGIS